MGVRIRGRSWASRPSRPARDSPRFFEAYLNGTPVSDDVLSPGWSSYEWRLRYRSYGGDRAAGHVCSRHCARQWLVSGRLGWGGGQGLRQELAALAQLEIEFSDGHVQTVVTDEGWTAGPSTVFNDIDGETIDARRQSDAWLQPGSPMRAGKGTPAELDFATLTPYIGPPVQRQEELEPTKIWTSPPGKTHRRFRAEPGRLGAAARTRLAGSSLRRRGLGATNWVPGRYGPRGHRPLHLSR